MRLPITKEIHFYFLPEHLQRVTNSLPFSISGALAGGLSIPFTLARKRLRCNLLHSPALQTQYPMATSRKGKIVGGNERGQLVIAMEPGNQFKNRVRCTVVEVSGGLIRQQKLGPCDERPC